MKIDWIRGLGLWALAASLLVGCGGGGKDRTKAQLRLVNASSGYAELDLLVDDSRRQAGVGYGAAAGYVEVAPDKARSAITRAGSGTPLLSLTPALAKNRSFTLLAYGREGALQSLLIDDNAAAPASGRSTLRVLNAAPDAGALDIYLTGTDEPLASAVPVQGNATAGVLGPALTLDATTWRLRITAAGNKADLRLDLPAVVLASQQVATLVLTPGRGGVLVNALLVVQQAAITRHDTPQARVRVAAGVADSAAVSASVGGTALTTSVGSPAVGLYTLLPAGTQPVVLAVNGTPLAAANVVLAAGGDYTLLVSGLPAAPAANWLEDDNRPSASTGSAKVRLVHGVAAPAATLSMTVDFVPVAEPVASGLASAYASITASTTARLAVTAAGLGLSNPLFIATEQRLDAGATYSVFVVGAANSPVGILRKDR